MNNKIRLAGAIAIAAAISVAGTWFAAMSSYGRQAAGIEERIVALSNEQQKRETELTETRQKIDAAARELKYAQAELEFFRCEVRTAGILSAARTGFASYMRDVALYERCEAANEAKRSKSTLFGTLLGVGLAAATGGGSLLLAGAGAAVGSAGASSEVCPPKPPEVRTEDSFVADALAKEGLAAMPVCQKPVRE
jgi:hypothetical protein